MRQRSADPITVHTGLAEVPVGLPRIRCRLAENKHAYARRAQVDRTASRQSETTDVIDRVHWHRIRV